MNNRNKKNLPAIIHESRKTLRRKSLNENYMQLLPNTIIQAYNNGPDELLWNKFPEFVEFAFANKDDIIDNYNYYINNNYTPEDALIATVATAFEDWGYDDEEMQDEYDVELYSRLMSDPNEGALKDPIDFLWRNTVKFIISGDVSESRKAFRRKSLNEKRKAINKMKLLKESAEVNRIKEATYNKIMSDIIPVIQESLNDQEINELFGFNKSVEKPSQELSITYIQETSTDDIAELLSNYMNYWMSKADDNVDKAIMASANQIHEICQSGKENCQKLFMGIVKAVKSGLSSTGEKSKSIGRILLMGCAICIKMVANGISMAKNALSTIYKTTLDYIKNGYEACKTAIEKGVDAIDEKFEIFCKVSTAVLILIANKFVNATEVFGNWVKQVFTDIKNEVKMAALLVRTWFDVKINSVKEFLSNAGKEMKTVCVNTYNKIDKAVRKSWKKLSDKVVIWINNVRVTFAKLGEKISDTVTKTGDAIIAGKDKAVLTGINKAVKMLSNKYSEDDVVAIVRKAYHEGLTFDTEGRCVINESYYMNTRLQLV